MDKDPTPWMVEIVNTEPEAEILCPGCPNAYGEAQSLFDVNFDGPGPLNLPLGHKAISLCCKAEKVIGHYAEKNSVEERIVFER